jgi:hypothetical protein
MTVDEREQLRKLLEVADRRVLELGGRKLTVREAENRERSPQTSRGRDEYAGAGGGKREPRWQVSTVAALVIRAALAQP